MNPLSSGTPASSAIKVLICSCLADEEWRVILESHLAALCHQGLIRIWHEQQIQAGVEREPEIKSRLESAQIILILISSDFIASEHCASQLQSALERHAQGRARVIPILLRPVIWQGTSFSHLQVLPNDAKPISLWENRDQAFEAVAQSIQTVAEAIANGVSLVDLDSYGSLLCPYKGLSAFQEKDAPFFFGRERCIEDLVRRVYDMSLVAVVGPSGSGKSSLVLAGLLPKLSSQWQVYKLRPGFPDKRPFHNLAAACLPVSVDTNSDSLLRIKHRAEALQQRTLTLQDIVSDAIRQRPSTQQVLFVIDQFEELYTLCPEGDRQPFIDTLLQGLEDSRCKVVLTLRADFYSNVLSYRPLVDAFQNSNLLLGAMNREELDAAVEQPAKTMGVRLESGLSDRILDEVGNEVGNLPLLEFALTQLWEQQQQRMLTHQGYARTGGVKQALANHAETVYSQFSPLEKQQAKQIFLQLVSLNDDVGDTRRLATAARLKCNPPGHWLPSSPMNDCW